MLIVLTESDALCHQGEASPVQRLHSFAVATIHTHTLRWNAHFSQTHTDYFATQVNTVNFFICLILWCKCSVLLWCGVCVGGGGLDFWLGQRRFSMWDCHLLYLFYPLLFLRGDVLSVTFLSFGSWLKNWKSPFCWNWSQAHSWLFSVCAVVLSRFFPVATIQHVSTSCWLTCI